MGAVDLALETVFESLVYGLTGAKVFIELVGVRISAARRQQDRRIVDTKIAIVDTGLRG